MKSFSALSSFAHRVGTFGSLALIATFSLAVNDDGGCGRGSSSGSTDVIGDTGIPDESCVVASDCEDRGLPRLGCDGAWQCADSLCAWECDRTEPLGCYANEECPSGFRCNSADVCLSPPGCGPGADCPAVCYGACVPDDVNGCFSNSECGAGNYCDFSDCGVAPQGLVACTGTCKPLNACTTQADCDSNELCACVPPGFSMPSALMACELQCIPRDAQCFNDGECKEGYVCRDYQCTPRTAACWSVEDCPLGWSCNEDCGARPAGDAADVACPRSCVPPEGGGTCGEGGPVCGENEHCEDTCWIDVPDCGCTPDGSNDCACPGELVCSATCVPDNGWGDCASDGECPGGYYCGCNPDAASMCTPACLPNDRPWDCSADADCSEGFCRIEVCETDEPACDPSGQCEAPYTRCFGFCTEPFDCSSDAECAPDGHCKIDWDACGVLPPGEGDRMMPPACQGWCRYPEPEVCGPDGVVCGDGEVCEEQWDCGTGADERRPCWSRWACVPTDGTCRSDSDCEAPGLCQNGVCEALYCWDGRCPAGYGCQSWCGPMPPLPNGLIACPMVCLPEAPPCVDDCGCNINEACVNGGCVEITGPNQCRWIGCENDSECAATEQCMVMCPLCLPDMACPPCMGECISRSTCYADTDCNRGEFCDFEATSLPASQACDCSDCTCTERPARAGICSVQTP